MRTRGFTVLEILFALAILALATTIVFVSLGKLNSSQTLEKSADLVVSILDEARSLTLSAKEDSQYGVYLESDRITFFKGETFSAGNPENVVTELHPSVGIQNISLNGGGQSVVFERLTGNTARHGSFEVFWEVTPTELITINITPTGIVEPEI